MKEKFRSILISLLAFLISVGTIPTNFYNAHAEAGNDYGVVGAYEAYSVLKELYEQGKKLKTGNEMIYVRSNIKGGSNEAGKIAYCFNANRSVPDIKSSAPDYIGEEYTEDTLITYTKLAGTNDKFSKLTTNARERAREAILKIVYNGFRDGEGNRVDEIKNAFKARYPDTGDGNISDPEIYAATQKAIWYYTDSAELVTKIPKEAQIIGDEIDATMNTKTWYVYQFLLGQDLTDDNPLKGKTLNDAPVNNTLDLFQPTRLHESHNTGYQNLLSCEFVSSNGETNYTEYEVKIKKIDKDDKSTIMDARLKLEVINGESIDQRLFIWTTKENDGNLITFKLPVGEYLLTELKAPNGYKVADPITIKVSDTGEIKYSSKNQIDVIANDKTVVMEDEKIPTMTVNVNKEWKDKNEGTPSDLDFLSAKVKLLADGKAAVDASGHKVPEQLLNKMSSWKASFTNLPIYRNGNTSGEKIVYSVSESDMNKTYKLVEGGDTNVSGESDKDIKEIKLVNKESDTPQPEEVYITKVQVNKKWSNQDKKSTKDIYFELWKVKAGEESIVTSDDFAIPRADFKARQKLQPTVASLNWTNLFLKEQGYTFKVKEVDENGNPWHDKENGYKENAYTVESNVDKSKQLLIFNVTNHYEENKETKVSFSKKALTENGEELAGAKIKLTKKDDTTEEGTTVIKEWVTDGKLTEFELEAGSYTFTEVSAPDKYQVATAITFEVKDGKVLVKGTEVKGNTIVMVD
ncbi:SpaA isopeptide-forming pilin-related protein, partial [Peptostreptococcus sp. D1]|uniref:SpaA isopeptide-forming pilin-related protein n=1 Tax=Peptostreptococcus sp. D1 TaxID=72304 RepID=UPI0008E9BF1F